ncbi:MAG: PAS domain S-box protein [Desulforhopalus sp.]|nr:PAS domain S-box protein [Desulforhopalus sp.]
MSTANSLSVENLGRITILQSMVTLMPSQTSMLDFVCQGLKGVAGIKKLSYRFGCQTSPPSVSATQISPMTRILPVKYKTVTYAELYLEIAESDVFEPYVPFLQNFTNMLGVVFEEKAQRTLNEALMADLEQRVVERTMELQEKQEDLRITLNSIGDAVISANIESKVTNMNPVAEALTGWVAEEALGVDLSTVFRIVNTHTLQPAPDPVKSVLASGKVVDLANHTSLISKSGVHYQIADSAAPILDNTGNIRGVVLVFRDVTDEYRVAEELVASEEKYRRIVEETSDLITRTDETGRFTYVNHCAERIFGFPPEECLGKSAFAFIHPEDLEKTEKWFSDCTNHHLLRSSFENRQINQITQEVFHLLWTCNFHYADNGNLRLVHGVAHDITERKRIEEEKSRLESQLLQAKKMESVGQLAGGVAHDFNNMLGVILGHTEMIMEQLDPSQPLYADLQEIHKAASRSTDITRQLLAFARRQTIAPRVIDLNDTIEGMLKMLRRLIGEDIDLAWLPGSGLWPVKMDPSQIDQILANLCVNARAAIAGVGKLTVETSNSTFTKEYCGEHAGFVSGDYARITVSDNGCGMDKETLAHIFEPFFTTKGVGEGTGLGLATVYGAVRQNNGFVNVYSEPGQGTTFTIYLPRHSSQAEPKQTADLPTLPERGNETILVVEDEPVLLKMTTTMLQHLGYTVLTAATPHDAINLVGNHARDIHLLLTDVVMPGMNGRDLAKKLLQNNPHLRCLFMSGYTSDVITLQGILDEGIQFIQKPFSKHDLASKLRTIFEKN